MRAETIEEIFATSPIRQIDPSEIADYDTPQIRKYAVMSAILSAIRENDPDSSVFLALPDDDSQYTFGIDDLEGEFPRGDYSVGDIRFKWLGERSISNFYVVDPDNSSNHFVLDNNISAIVEASS